MGTGFGWSRRLDRGYQVSPAHARGETSLCSGDCYASCVSYRLEVGTGWWPAHNLRLGLLRHCRARDSHLLGILAYPDHRSAFPGQLVIKAKKPPCGHGVDASLLNLKSRAFESLTQTCPQLLYRFSCQFCDGQSYGTLALSAVPWKLPIQLGNVEHSDQSGLTSRKTELSSSASD